MDVSVTYLEKDAVLKLKTLGDDIRTPTHFLVLLDLSESMSENNKLRNVKHCLNLLVDFLQAGDYFSLVTFADEASVKLAPIEASSVNKAIIQDTLALLNVEGCTNLSAGLSTVLSLYKSLPTMIKSCKTGIMLLTDGYANRGITSEQQLQTLVRAMYTQMENVSFSTVAYGNDHNSNLLKNIAEVFQTSYSIIGSIEDAAMSMGDILGGLISTMYQNVHISIPTGTRLFGKYKEVVPGEYVIGDILANTETLLLIETSQKIPVKVSGMELSTLNPFEIEAREEPAPTERMVDVELLRLRYTCSDLLKRIREPGPRTTLAQEIRDFANTINQEVYNDNELANLLRREIPILEGAFENRMDASQIAQHEVFIGLGRGIQSLGYSNNAHDDEEECCEDPSTVSMTRGVSAAAGAVASPYQNRIQRNITELLRSRSMR